jgi:hypothetical protein
VGGLSRCESRFGFSFEACQGRRCRLRLIRLNAEERKADRHTWDVLIDQEGTGKVRNAAPSLFGDGPDRRARSQVVKVKSVASRLILAFISDSARYSSIPSSSTVCFCGVCQHMNISTGQCVCKSITMRRGFVLQVVVMYVFMVMVMFMLICISYGVTHGNRNLLYNGIEKE